MWVIEDPAVIYVGECFTYVPEQNSESSDLIKEGCLCGEENVAWQNEPDFGQLEY